MFVQKSRQGKKTKYYLVLTYRENNKVKRIKRYLGENLSEEDVKKKRKIAEPFIKDKLREIKKQQDPLKYAIEDEELEYINKLIKSAKIKDIKYNQHEWQRFYESFTYNTNAIEGSKLELNEVKNLFEKEKWPKDKSKEDIAEALGVEEAITFTRNTKKHISLDLIKELHYIVFKNSKDYAGNLRNQGVVVVSSGGVVIHRGAPHHQVESLLTELEIWYTENKKKYHPIVLAAVAHNQFETIHPFGDGNGRVGRLLLNNILMKHKLPPIIITLKNRYEYYETLQAYQKQNNILPTIRFIIKTYKETLKEVK